MEYWVASRSSVARIARWSFQSPAARKPRTSSRSRRVHGRPPAIRVGLRSRLRPEVVRAPSRFPCPPTRPAGEMATSLSRQAPSASSSPGSHREPSESRRSTCRANRALHRHPDASLEGQPNSLRSYAATIRSGHVPAPQLTSHASWARWRNAPSPGMSGATVVSALSHPGVRRRPVDRTRSVLRSDIPGPGAPEHLRSYTIVSQCWSTPV